MENGDLRVKMHPSVANGDSRAMESTETSDVRRRRVSCPLSCFCTERHSTCLARVHSPESGDPLKGGRLSDGTRVPVDRSQFHGRRGAANPMARYVDVLAEERASTPTTDATRDGAGERHRRRRRRLIDGT
jgi:hypothetical protein